MITENARLIATNFIKASEKCVLVGYLDMAGVPTDGYGNTHEVHLGLTISQRKADADLNANITTAIVLLCKKVSDEVICLLNDYEQAALISFVFNCGAGNWNIWKLLNAKKFDLIPNELMRFDHATVKGKLVEVKGLKNRREAEVNLWKSEDQIWIAPIQQTPVSNNLNVVPKPNAAKQTQADVGVKSVATVTAASGVVVASHKFGLSPLFLHLIVGFLIGCVFCLTIGLVFYLLDLKKAKSDPANQFAKWFNEMSPAFQTALTDLVNAAKASTASAVAAVQTQLDAANAEIATLQTQVTQADADDTAAVVAATAQFNPPAA